MNTEIEKTAFAAEEHPTKTGFVSRWNVSGPGPKIETNS
jgi:hypothetical protein